MLETWSSTFNDDGHYSDIHWNVSGGGGAARIPTRRPSFVDEPGLEVNQMRGEDISVEQLPTSSGGYQGLNPAELAALRQPPAQHHSSDTGSDQQRSSVDPEAHQEPVQQSENGNQRSLEQLQQPSRSSDHNDALRLDGDVNQRGYEGLDPSVVEELGRPQRPHSYAGIDASSPTDRSDQHNYLEVIGYSGTNNIDDAETTAENYAGLDPAEVEEMRRPENRPHDYSGLTDGNSGNRQGEMVESEDYQGLDPVEMEEARQRASRPHEHN